MLFNILVDAIRQIRHRRAETHPIKIVCATRSSADIFWLESPMGISIQKLKTTSKRIKWDIFFSNTEAISKIYNRAISRSSSKEILIFVHDDVWLNEHSFVGSVDAGLRHYSIVGVAGNTRRVPFQPAWLFKSIENENFIWDWGHLSGAVWHKMENAPPAVSEYGPMAPCELLDGVFLACRANILKSHRISFDERFDFHFYDMDFCRSARAAGASLGTWNVQLVHESKGNFGSPGWWKNFELYRLKWNS